MKPIIDTISHPPNGQKNFKFNNTTCWQECEATDIPCHRSINWNDYFVKHSGTI